MIIIDQHLDGDANLVPERMHDMVAERTGVFTAVSIGVEAPEYVRAEIGVI